MVSDCHKQESLPQTGELGLHRHRHALPQRCCAIGSLATCNILDGEARGCSTTPSIATSPGVFVLLWCSSAIIASHIGMRLCTGASAVMKVSARSAILRCAGSAMMRRTRTTCAHDGEREAKRSGGQPCFEVSGCEEGCSQHNVMCGSEWTQHTWAAAAAQCEVSGWFARHSAK